MGPKYQNVGNYNIEFSNNAINQDVISSGVYFYRIRANNFLATKKMVILN